MLGRPSGSACVKCGRLVPPGAGFCPNCGTQLGDAPFTTAAQDPETGLTGATHPGDGPAETTGVSPTSATEQPMVNPTSVPTSMDSPAPRPAVRADDGPFQPGQQVGPRYTIIKLLGIGGMGAVYQAFDHELGVAVSIKVIRPAAQSDATAAKELEQRFKRELVLARQVTHKYVVRIHDLGEIGGIKYLTMPFVEGETLAEVLRRAGTLPLPRAIQIATQIAQGLAAAHEKGVVHRDLKPENIMIETRSDSPIPGGGGDALIMDFGIARSVEQGATQTAAGSVIGTLEYMAPEQAQGVKVDQRADQYSFGLIFYDMLIGRQRLAKRDNAMTELLARMGSPPAPARSINPDIPEPVDQIVTRCLLPSPDARFGSTADLVRALESLTPDGHIRTDLHDGATPRPKWQLAAAALLIIALGGGAGWVLSRAGGSTSAPAVVREPVSVLIADFENKTGDAVFDGVVEQAIGFGIEGASFITAYPRRDALRAAAAIKPGAKLDEATARLVALREGVSTIVAGEISRAGSGYHIRIKGLGPGNDAAVRYTLEGDAAGKAEVLATVGALAGQVRIALGDTEVPGAGPLASETFTAASLEAASAYALGQELQAAGKRDEAIKKYSEAIALDPDFGRAYSGRAAQYEGLGRPAEAEKDYQEALARIDRMTDREKYRTRGLYYLFARKPEQAVGEFTSLLKAYPFDTTGLANLALARFYLRDFTQALEQGRKAAALQPNNIVRHSNIALYAMYAGQFEAAVTESTATLRLNPATLKAFVARALSELALGRTADAIKTYEALARTSPEGASFAAAGLADIAVFEGRLADAAAVLDKGIDADLAQKNVTRAATKRVARAEIRLARGDAAGAVADAQAALAATSADAVRTAAGLLLARAVRREDAEKIASALENKLEADPQAYGKLVRSESALAQGHARVAVDFARDAGKLANTWLGHVTLGRAYLELEAFPEAYSELEAALKRQGEATAIFLDDVPTYRYFAPVHYYLGRAQEGLKSPAAAQSYKTFLTLKKGTDPSDALVTDARNRLTKLGG